MDLRPVCHGHRTNQLHPQVKRSMSILTTQGARRHRHGQRRRITVAHAPPRLPSRTLHPPLAAKMRRPQPRAPGPARRACPRQPALAEPLLRRPGAPAPAPHRGVRPRRVAARGIPPVHLRRRPPRRARRAGGARRRARGPAGGHARAPRRERQHHLARQLRADVAPPAAQPRRRDAAPVARPRGLRPRALLGSPRARRRVGGRRRRAGGRVPARHVLPPRAHVLRRMKVFAFCPAVTKHIFRGRIQTSLALRRRQKELFMPLISARRERKNQLAERAVPEKETTTFEHSYVDTLLDIKLPEDGGDRALTDDEMVRLCSEFLDAGTDTMSTTLQWIMAELVKNPSIQSKLHDEIKSKTSDDHDEITEEDTQKMPYLKAVILEGLRKHPPGHFALPHKAAEDMEVGGYLIPKGATVNFMVAEMGRDEKEWENPMEFMPERFLPGGDGEGVDVTGSKGIRMMPFGVGRRICAGLNTAMLHLEYFVANMVREFEWREIAGEEVDFAEKLEFTTVMAKPLRAQLVRRRMN
ncbi:Os10g0514500 [Oryza sativa Japonica Group]|uniref:Os10g0514500 protein n=1 Tax=Oryza sativa subsp. japonica TaxID=39947 RepID=A0A0P0XW68_ORYSJ|nr:Os10g0514500 [Oryza sativa Japonica Group]